MEKINKTKEWIQEENRRRGEKRKVIKARFLFLLFLFILFASLIFSFRGFLKELIIRHCTGEKRINIIVCGLDGRKNEIGRSDTLFLVTLDPINKKIYDLSIPRDTRVYVDNMPYPDDWDKINSTANRGGIIQTKRVLEKFLGLKIDYTVTVDFEVFPNIIDCFGGIDIDIEKNMHYEDPWDENGGLVIDFKPGIKHMNGKEALKYVRFRDKTGDIGRIERRQKFFKVFMNNVLGFSSLVKMPKVIKTVYSEIQTDIPLSLILSWATLIPDFKKNVITAQTIPGRPLYIDGISYWVPNIIKTRELISQIQGVHNDRFSTEETMYLSEKYEKSIPNDSKRVIISQNKENIYLA